LAKCAVKDSGSTNGFLPSTPALFLKHSLKLQATICLDSS